MDLVDNDAREGAGGGRTSPASGSNDPADSASRGAPDRPAEGSPDHVDHLIDVALRIALLGRRADTAGDMVFEDEHRERVDRRSKGRGLLEDVHAVLLPLDHSGDAPDLALDSRQATDQLGLVAAVGVPEGVRMGSGLGGRLGIGHASMILPRGIGFNPPAGPVDRLHSARMDPLDHLRALPDGLLCTVCEERVPAVDVRVVASREDVSFLRIDCPGCRSTTLGILQAETGLADGPSVPRSRGSHGARPISADDVLDMHEFLATWHGDLETLAR